MFIVHGQIERLHSGRSAMFIVHGQIERPHSGRSANASVPVGAINMHS